MQESAEFTNSTPDQPVATHRRRRLRRICRTVLIGSTVYFALMVVLMIFEEKLIFFPTPYPIGDWSPAGLEFHDVEFTAADGVRLHGWYCPVPGATTTILFSHGNAGNISHRADEVLLWQERLGMSVFVYDYRGFGRSAGSPNEAGVYADARAAYRWLIDEQRVPADQIVLRGESIGSAVALQLALEVPHRALVMQSPFTSAVEMGERSFPWLPVRSIMRNRFDNLAKISGYRGPLLVQHGQLDSIVPIEMGRRLFDRANDPKRFHAIPQADHNDVPFVGGHEYFEVVRQFLDDTSTR